MKHFTKQVHIYFLGVFWESFLEFDREMCILQAAFFFQLRLLLNLLLFEIFFQENYAEEGTDRDTEGEHDVDLLFNLIEKFELATYSAPARLKKCWLNIVQEYNSQLGTSFTMGQVKSKKNNYLRKMKNKGIDYDPLSSRLSL